MQADKRTRPSKKSSLRSRFEDNYLPVEVPADNRRGYKIVYMYYGQWYIWIISEKDFKLKKAEIWLLEFLGLFLFIAIVSLETPLNNMKLVYAPLAFGICFQVMELAALIDFVTAKVKTTKMKFQNISRGLGFFPGVRAVFFVVAFVACLIYMLMGYASLLSAAVAAGSALCAASAYLVKRIFSGIEFYTEKNDNLRKYNKWCEENEKTESTSAC